MASSSPFSLPVDLTVKSMNNCSSGVGSNVATPITSVPSPVFSTANSVDLHAALNNIPKSFTIGGGRSMGLKFAPTTPIPSLGTRSPTPPPCPPPNISLWSVMSSASALVPPAPPPQAPCVSLVTFTTPPCTSSPSRVATPPTITSGKTSPCAPVSSLSAASASTSQVSAATPTSSPKLTIAQMSKYNQLLAVLEEMGKDVRPSYAGSKSSAERLKRGIVHARILVREALVEAEKSAKQ